MNILTPELAVLEQIVAVACSLRAIDVMNYETVEAPNPGRLAPLHAHREAAPLQRTPAMGRRAGATR
jgi:hypothetical protein